MSQITKITNIVKIIIKKIKIYPILKREITFKILINSKTKIHLKININRKMFKLQSDYRIATIK
jgi:hypothetical protein